jgi:hypothetical protein
MQFRFAFGTLTRNAGSDHAIVVADLEFTGTETLKPATNEPGM